MSAVLYLWMKALHVAAAITFVGGVLADALVLAMMARTEPAATERALPLQSLRGWGQAVTTPAMLLAWTLGLVLAVQGGWFAFGWLRVKLAAVLALSAIHGVQSGRLRRLEGGGRALTWMRLAPVILAMVVAICALAVAKPF